MEEIPLNVGEANTDLNRVLTRDRIQQIEGRAYTIVYIEKKKLF